ncbi:PGF-CTERM sorting domain-containing protein [Halopiger thermotolerans]
MRTLLPRGAGDGRARTALVLAALVAVSSVAAVGLAVGAAGAGTSDAGSASGSLANPAVQQNVSETEFVAPVPEEGDPYFEARADDGSWVSYVNPRDEYRSPYLGDGSGKICVSLFNEAGQVVAGESVPNTTVTVPTGESLDWHSHANPMTVEYPLTDHYERPLDGDQFGTDPEFIQGDGYLDAHCIGIHGLPEDGQVQYGEAEISGEHADDIELVGYVQQEHDAWETDVDPIEDAESYEEAGGGWNFYPNRSHGQVVVVLQLDGDRNVSLENATDDGNATDAGDGNATNSSSADENASSESTPSDANETDESGGDESADGAGDSLPGFGAVAAIAALGSAMIARYVGSRPS